MTARAKKLLGPGRVAMSAGALSALLLAGCKLVDQRTFDPQAGRPPAVPRPPAPPGPQPDRMLDGLAPLVTIRLGQDTTYDQAVEQATAAALARKRDAQFTVLTAVPPGAPNAPPGAQANAVARYAPEAARVAGLIERRGVPAGRVHLEARPEPNLAAPELRLYVR